MLRDVSIKAVILGTALDWIVSLFLGLSVGAYVVLEASIHHPGQPPDIEAISNTLKTNSMALMMCALIAPASVLPGFVTGWIARTSRVKNAFIMSLVATMTSLILLPFNHGFPDWYFPMASVLFILFACVGGVMFHLAFSKEQADRYI